MRFLIDAMLPPGVCDLLSQMGNEAVTPVALGAHNLPDETLIEAAERDNLVIVTENAQDFAKVTTCSVVLVRKGWWPSPLVAKRLAAALDHWASDHPDPGPWAHWLTDQYR